jgi:hypothetical protein
VRTFPEFVGTWVLDEAASTGRLRMAPPPARTITIATTTTDITVTETLQLEPETRGGGRRLATETPPPVVYRFDGSETVRVEGIYEHRSTFALVADALALTTKTRNWVRRGDPQMSEREAFTAVTDAYSVEGDVLIVHRQLTSVNGSGQIYVMQGPTGNVRQTYVYRRIAVGL